MVLRELLVLRGWLGILGQRVRRVRQELPETLVQQALLERPPL